MKIIIAGSRDIKDKTLVSRIIDDAMEYLYNRYIYPDEYEWIERIVSGCAEGVDAIGEEWAKANGVTVRHFKANWDWYGNKAGPIRNNEMADFADALICIRRRDSKGSKNMTDVMNRKNKIIVQYIYDGE